MLNIVNNTFLSDFRKVLLTPPESVVKDTVKKSNHNQKTFQIDRVDLFRGINIFTGFTTIR